MKKLNNLKSRALNKVKKPFYKRWWFVGIVLLLVLMSFGIENDYSQYGNNINSNVSTEVEDKKQSDSEVDIKEDNKDKEKQKSEEVKEMPTIKSSQAYDIVLSLEENGIPKPKTQSTDDGYSWSSFTNNYSYYIVSNKKHEVAYAEFMVLRGDGEDYLKYCATLPYKNSQPDKAKKWIEDNIGKEAKTIISDVVFELSNGKSGPILIIKSKDYDKYLDYKIKNELNKD
ncbi:hypothetical protein [Anaerofustis butyriciformans]|uniref:hypothetical protein n=1 Tax=Anaerofustis butyriciformans TaxID=3108533 RepID=UPI002E35DCE9|nr:hypothetical protein [Anaerofustis sp. HA2171]